MGQRFADVWSFGRPRVAGYRDGDGAPVDAAIDAPRFDHDALGRPRGLLIEPGPRFGEGDLCTTAIGDWALIGPATVLHEYDEGGAIVRTARYTLDPRPAVDAALAITARHRTIGVVPIFLRNMGDAVHYRQLVWSLAPAIDVGDGAILSDGSPVDRLIVMG